MSCVSSIYSNVSRTLRLRLPTKPKKIVFPAPSEPPIETVTDFALPMTLPQTSIVIAEPPTRPKRKAATKATRAIQPSHKRKRSSPSITESDESMASTQTCPPNLSANTAPSRQKRRQILKQQQISPNRFNRFNPNFALQNAQFKRADLNRISLSELLD